MKNKIFLGLILGIFLIGIVSASITGYLTARGGGIQTDRYTATLQKVEGTTAIVSVRTPTGDSELVRVQEGGTAKVGDATISADNLRSGNLFRRGGGNIGLNISNISAAPAPIKVPGGVNVGEAVTGAHTHLINPILRRVEFNINSANYVTALSTQNLVDLTIFGYDSGIAGNSAQMEIIQNQYKRISVTVACKPDEMALGATYSLGGSNLEKSDYQVRAVAPHYGNLGYPMIYTLDILELYSDSDPQDGIDDAGISNGVLFATCARIEQAIGSGEPHF